MVDAKSLYRRERDPVPILQQCTGGSASLGTGTDGKEKSRPHRGRCPDSTANDTFLLSSKWHKEVFNDFCFYHVPFFSDMSRATTAIHHILSSRPSSKTLQIYPRDLFLRSGRKLLVAEIYLL